MPQIHAAETSALMKVLDSCTRITEHQRGDSRASFPVTADVLSISYYKTPSVLAHGVRGELSGKEQSLTSPWRKLLLRCSLLSEASGRTDPQRKRRCLAICKGEAARTVTQKRVRNTSRNLFSPTLSLPLGVRQRLVV